MRPTDDQLHQFLLGTLTPAEAEEVDRWLETAPDAADLFAAADQPDSLVAALDQGGDGCSDDTVNRTARPSTTRPPVGGVEHVTATPSQPERTPHFPGYHVTSELARGGMGRVFAALDGRLNREVAIKTLLPGADPTRFVVEAGITARLPHPGIPPVHALGLTADGTPYLVMKLIRGRTLAAWLDARPSPTADQADLLRVFEQVAQAVGFAHARGVIHRDLKPQNVMVGEFGEVQVMDWGLAREARSSEGGSGEGEQNPSSAPHAAPGGPQLTATGTVMGTPGYMAPEQARGEAVDARADVFALGSLLSAVLTGQPAFTADTTRETVGRAAAGDMAPVFARLDASGADGELVALAKGCLTADREHRPADGRAVATEMAAYRAGVETRLRKAEAEAVGATVREAEQRKRRRVLVWAGGVIAVVLLAGIVSTALGLLRAEEKRVEADQAREREKERADGEDRAKRVALRAEQDTLDAYRASTDDAVEQLIGSKATLGSQERAYLERSRQRWQAFADRKGEDERSRAVRAEGHFRVGHLLLLLGERSTAEEELRVAVAEFRQLATDSPTKTGHRHGLAESLGNLGFALLQLSRRAEAAGCAREAIGWFDGLVAEFPGVIHFRRGAAGNRTNLGNLLDQSGDLAGAEKEYRAGIALLEASDPVVLNSSHARRELAASHNNLSNVLADLKRMPEAVDHLRRAMEIQTAVTAEQPNSLSERRKLASYQHNLGFLNWGMGKRTEAVAELRAALTLWERLAADFPALAEHRSYLANVLCVYAALLSEIGDHAGAEKALNRAVELLDKLIAADPKVAEYHRTLGDVLTNRARARAGLGSTVAALADIAAAGLAQGTSAKLDPAGTSAHMGRAESRIRQRGTQPPKPADTPAPKK